MKPAKLSDSERAEVVRMVVCWVLSRGCGCTRHLDELLPMWKQTSLYRRGVVLGKKLLDTYAPSWKIKDALRKLESIGGPPPYDRDFFLGLEQSCCHSFINGAYRRLEFPNRPELRAFLEGGEHGQRIIFTGVKKKGNRTVNLPFLEAPPQGNLDHWFLGCLCGAAAVVRDGELQAEVKPACEPNLRELGIIYDRVAGRNGDRLSISPFYVVLYMADFPLDIQGYWMRHLPSRGLEGALEASKVAAMHWHIMHGTKSNRFREAFPFLLSLAHGWNVGFSGKVVKQEAARRRFDHVDERIRNRLKRWHNLQLEARKQPGATNEEG